MRSCRAGNRATAIRFQPAPSAYSLPCTDATESARNPSSSMVAITPLVVDEPVGTA